jgi:hypothetical protein
MGSILGVCPTRSYIPRISWPGERSHLLRYSCPDFEAAYTAAAAVGRRLIEQHWREREEIERRARMSASAAEAPQRSRPRSAW